MVNDERVVRSTKRIEEYLAKTAEEQDNKKRTTRTGGRQKMKDA